MARVMSSEIHVIRVFIVVRIVSPKKVVLNVLLFEQLLLQVILLIKFFLLAFEGCQEVINSGLLLLARETTL